MIDKIALVFYYSILQHLPSSFLPLGTFFNYLRVTTIRKVFPVGSNTKLQPNVYVGSGANISIGNYCHINERVKINNVKISDFVMIAPGVTILGRMHEFSKINIPMVLQGEIKVKQTLIEDDVWIGTNAIIMPGLVIRKGCIIGAGAVVTKDTEPFGIYGGVPAKLIKQRSATIPAEM